jgi:hypothetical protein
VKKRSFLEDAQKLIDELHGTGEPKMTESGKWTNKEFIEFTSVIGLYRSKDGVIEYDTTRISIHYSKRGAHVVPAKPKKEV